jgi:Cu+-exporting ATPase
MIKDPVCGMTVNPQQAAASIQYKGKTYYFCSQMCKMMFEREPEKYAQTNQKVENYPAESKNI